MREGLTFRVFVATVVVGTSALFGAYIVDALRPDAPLFGGTQTLKVHVTPSLFDGAQAASASLTMSPPATVFLGEGADGLVTESRCAAGEVIREGQVILATNGQTRRGLATSAPLFRPLRVGTSGRDVTDLTSAIHRLDNKTLVTNTMTAAVLRKLQSLLRLSNSHSIKPSDVVWLPSPVIAIQSCNIAVGSMISGGDAIFVSSPAPRRLAIPPMDNGPLPGAVVFRYQGTEVPLDERLTSITTSDLAPLMATAPTNGAGADSATLLQGEIALKNPVETWAVPSAAVTLNGQQACVVAVKGNRRALVRVQIVGSTFGTSYVTGLVGVESVLVNPSGNNDRC